MNEPINIEEQFQNYLIRVKLDKNKMPDFQYEAIKRAFYGGASAMLALCSNEIPSLPDDKAVIALEGLWQEAMFFWNITRF